MSKSSRAVRIQQHQIIPLILVKLFSPNLFPFLRIPNTLDAKLINWWHLNAHSSSKDLFVSFVHDTVKEIALNILAPDSEAQNPIWMPQKPIRKMLMSVPRTEPLLIRSVQNEVDILLGYEKRAQKENLIVRWSPQQKRRDRVDQVCSKQDSSYSIHIIKRWKIELFRPEGGGQWLLFSEMARYNCWVFH